MRFSGVYIDWSDSGFNIHQRSYIDPPKPLPSDANFILLRQYRGQLSWLIHSRPVVYVVANKLVQVTEKSFNISHMKQYNTTVRYLLDTRHLSLRICKLILRVCTHAPTLMHHFLSTLTTLHSSFTSYYWQTNTIMPVFCTTLAIRVAESHDPY